MVQRNENYKIDITGMTHEGLGVGKIDGFAVFVEGAIEGETVGIKVIKVKKNYAVGKLLNIEKPATSRADPFCGVYKRCGGCSLQHMTYEAQLKFKTNQVVDNIKRIGKLENVIVHGTIGMQDALRYRNKAQFPVMALKEGLAVGFYAKRSHDVVDSQTCGIQDEMSDKVREIVRSYIAENGVTVYDETTGEGLIRHIMTRVGFQTGEVMVVLVINGKDIPGKSELVDKLLKEIPSIKSIILNINSKKTNVILGDKNISIYGEDTITDYIGKFRFNISPLSFYQVNPVQTEVLYSKTLEYAGLTGKETVFDLYCGIGTISLFLSDKAKKVYGVEVVEEAVKDARRNAKLNSIDNVEFLVGKAEEVIPDIYGKGIKADVITVDPPRKGCDETLLRTLVDMQPERIVYVSCNPSTLARDLKYLEENGYRTIEIQPVDMFPHTGHVETVTLLIASC